jgi:hypothetical protein
MWPPRGPLSRFRFLRQVVAVRMIGGVSFWLRWREDGDDYPLQFPVSTWAALVEEMDR